MQKAHYILSGPFLRPGHILIIPRACAKDEVIGSVGVVIIVIVIVVVIHNKSPDFNI